MMAVVQRDEGDTAGIGSGSPCPTVIWRSLCKCLAGSIHLYECGGIISTEEQRHDKRLLATLLFCANNSPLSIDDSRRASHLVPL
jgi:hypothetical protein